MPQGDYNKLEQDRDSLKLLNSALKEALEALDQLWAAIGDRLLAEQPLSQVYANGVCRNIKNAQQRIKIALEKLEARR